MSWRETERRDREREIVKRRENRGKSVRGPDHEILKRLGSAFMELVAHFSLFDRLGKPIGLDEDREKIRDVHIYFYLYTASVLSKTPASATKE
jgi:hypothetical protein